MSGGRRWAARLALLALTAGAPVVAAAQVADAPVRGYAAEHPFAPFVAEAAERFGLPEVWIWAVMRAESAGRPQAVSHAGAMGLMQVLPATWAELRSRHGLGDDPFDPRDNILAGAAYLREMLDRFGSPGFLAAYNAGPTRYENHLATGRPLPAETRAYLATLAPVTGAVRAARAEPATVDAEMWRLAPLFIVRPSAHPTPGPNATMPFADPQPDGQTADTGAGHDPAIEALFFPLSGQAWRP